jgi:hypothetical protein
MIYPAALFRETCIMVKDKWIALKDTMREDNHVKLMSMLFSVNS